MKTPLATLALLALFATAWALSPAQQDRSQVQVVPRQVAGNVWWLEGAGGNIGVSAGPDGLLMIDDQFEDLAPKIRAALDEIASSPLKFLLNTHFHGDHTGGNPVFGKEAVILAHANVRERLANPTARGGRTPEPAPPVALPVVTYADGVTLHFNGEEIAVVHVPNAHTDGDSVVWFKGSNVVHLGDLFFSGRFPFVDIDSGGSVRGLTAGVKKVLAELPDDVKLIPGHGPLSTKPDLAEYVAMLETSQRLVAEALEAGKSADDMLREDLLADYADWSWGFINTERFLGTLVRELQSR